MIRVRSNKKFIAIRLIWKLNDSKINMRGHIFLGMTKSDSETFESEMTKK